jgi:2-polyprenyl-3-methyl-5-hydroxy-6-metoxy-1,4-benzoquinol methylase
MTGYRKLYTDKEAASYQQHKPEKHEAELRLTDCWFAQISRYYSVLDVPCGGGRVTINLAQRGYAITGEDVSEGIVQIARAAAAPKKLTYADRSFDAVICYRLFHHFPNPEIRRRAVRELCRVARGNVVMSYLSKWAYTAAYRRLCAALGGKKVTKFATSLAEVEGYFNQAGFYLVKDFARLPLIHQPTGGKK